MKVGSLVFSTDQGQTGVYGIYNSTSNKWYVGSSAVSITRRFRQHYNNLVSGTHRNRHLQSSWDKYGEESFQFIVLEYCSQEECIPREQYWIDKKRSSDRKYGYNKSPTAGSQLGLTHSDETKEHLSALVKNYWSTLSLEERKKISLSRRGRKHTPEAIEKIRTASTGRKHTEETLLKMSKVQKELGDNKRTEEHREKLRTAWRKRKARGPSKKEIAGRIAAGKKLIGQEFTEERKQAISEALKGRTVTSETRKRISDSLTGRALSEETKEKISRANKGRKLSEEQKAKFRAAWVIRKLSKK